MEEFKNRINLLLIEQGRSQSWLCLQVGKSRAMMNHYCKNTHQPPLNLAYKIAITLGVTIDDLIEKEKQDQ